MKEDKVKSVKRTIRDDIKLSLIKELKALTGKFGDASQKLDKEINRSAKKLAKKISKEIKTEEHANSVVVKEPKVANKVADAKKVKVKQA